MLKIKTMTLGVKAVVQFPLMTHRRVAGETSMPSALGPATEGPESVGCSQGSENTGLRGFYAAPGTHFSPRAKRNLRFSSNSMAVLSQEDGRGMEG